MRTDDEEEEENTAQFENPGRRIEKGFRIQRGRRRFLEYREVS